MNNIIGKKRLSTTGRGNYNSIPRFDTTVLCIPNILTQRNLGQAVIEQYPFRIILKTRIMDKAGNGK